MKVLKQATCLVAFRRLRLASNREINALDRKEERGDISIEVNGCCFLQHLSETKRIDLYK